MTGFSHILIFVSFTFCQASETQIDSTALLLCTSDPKQFTELPSLCRSSNEYSTSEFPEPSPVHIESRVRIKQLLAVDEDDETFTLFVDFVLTWNDTRVGIKKGNETKAKNWYPLLEKTLSKVWTPTVVFTNAISVKKLHTYGDELTRSFFYYNNPASGNQYFFYQVYLIIKMTCNLDFQKFPFDYQKCQLQYTNIIGKIEDVILNAPKIQNNNGTEDKIIEIESGILPFDAMVKSVKVDDRFDYEGYYSRAGVMVELVRDTSELNQLMGSYYGPTSIFALLSMFSFFVKPDQVQLSFSIWDMFFLRFSFQVPGRIGVIITLYLILINTYSSVAAPKSRGFSYIELWFVGVQVPIVFALLEYGIILAILRKKDNSSSMRIPGKKSGKWYHVANLIFTADVLSFLVSLLYFAIFNFVYWQSGIQAWDEHKQQFKTHDEI